MGFVNSMLLMIILSITINQFVLDRPVAATDVLRQGDELTDSLISAGGNFIVGFYGLESNSYALPAYYFAIWYNQNNQNKIPKFVWVANRDKPMFFPDGQVDYTLVIDASGALKVVKGKGSHTRTLFNVSNEVGSGKGINSRAVLEDSGNFVLYDNNSRVLWQSFDHPTDTLLPGMKLGYNRTSNQNWTLTSWLKDMVPASGAFTLSFEQDSHNSPHQLVIYRHGKVYWTSGQWMGGEYGFVGLPNLPVNNGIINGSLFSDASGTYFAIHKTSGGTSMLQLSSLGQLIADDINGLTPSSCIGYSYDDKYGCKYDASSECRDEHDGFLLEPGFWDGDKIYSDDNSNISLSDCMEICWKDCNCKAFSIIGPLDRPPAPNTVKLNPAGCYTFGVRVNFTPDQSPQKNGGVLLSQKPTISKKKQSKIPTKIWVVLGAIVFLSIFAALMCYVRRRKRRLQEIRRNDYLHQLTGSDSFNYGDELEKGIKDAPDVKIFSLKAISAATHNFSNKNKLGQGGYGPVYKGILSDGRQIAVKRLSKTSGQGIDEFKSELILISKLQHTNLVRLYGCCIHREEKMLIYEYMPNKSLDFFLFAEDKKETIDWHKRFNIIEGVAQGLIYLHKYSRMKVIHRDLKVSNVLLDENMNPKIADFGMARISQRNVTEEITNRVVGTYGYMAPEYAMRGTFSIKSDVFSFGVLILEIVSGKRNSRFYSHDRALNLLGYAWELWKGETPLELKDESLGESCDLNQLLRTIHVGLLCVQENADDRPTIPEIISILNNEITNLPSPKQPAFFSGTPLVEANIPASLNGLTITGIEAR